MTSLWRCDNPKHQNYLGGRHSKSRSPSPRTSNVVPSLSRYPVGRYSPNTSPIVSGSQLFARNSPKTPFWGSSFNDGTTQTALDPPGGGPGPKTPPRMARVGIERPSDKMQRQANCGHSTLNDSADVQRELELRRVERLRTGRTAKELRQHLEDAYPNLLTPCEKNKLIRDTLGTESSFTRLQELFLQFHH